MSDERFSIDTNVLVYSVDSSAGQRHRTAKEIVVRSSKLSCVIALQALSEFYSVVTRKGVAPRAEAARAVREWLDAFETSTSSPENVVSALEEASSGRLSDWDALLLATVAEAGCTALLTEDMADGATLLGVRIVNPFAAAGLTREAQALLLR